MTYRLCNNSVKRGNIPRKGERSPGPTSRTRSKGGKGFSARTLTVKFTGFKGVCDTEGKQRPSKDGGEGAVTGPPFPPSINKRQCAGANYGFKRPPFVFSCLFLCFTVVGIVSAERQKKPKGAGGVEGHALPLWELRPALLFLHLFFSVHETSLSSFFFFSPADPSRSLLFLSSPPFFFHYFFFFFFSPPLCTLATRVVVTDSNAWSIGRSWTSGGLSDGCSL